MMVVIEAEGEEGQDLVVVLHLGVIIQKDVREAKRNHDIHGPAAVIDTNQAGAITSDHRQIQVEFILEILHGRGKNLGETKEGLVQDHHLTADHVEGLDQDQDHTKRKEDIQDLVLTLDQDLDVIIKNQGPQAQKVITKKNHKGDHVLKIRAGENHLQYHAHHQQIQKIK